MPRRYACCSRKRPVPAAQSGFEETFHGFFKPSSKVMTREVWPPICITVFTPGYKWSSPADMASELLYSAQLSSAGIASLLEPEMPALEMPSSGKAWPSLASSAFMAALGLVIIFSLSSRRIFSPLSIRQSLALTEPTSIPSEYFIVAQ